MGDHDDGLDQELLEIQTFAEYRVQPTQDYNTLVNLGSERLVLAEYFCLHDLSKIVGRPPDNFDIINLATGSMVCKEIKNPKEPYVAVYLQSGRIKGLQIRNTNFWDIGMLERLTQLEWLDAPHSQVQNLEGIDGLKEIGYVDLSDSPVSRVGNARLEKHRMIQTIIMKNTPFAEKHDPDYVAMLNACGIKLEF